MDGSILQCDDPLLLRNGVLRVGWRETSCRATSCGICEWLTLLFFVSSSSQSRVQYRVRHHNSFFVVLENFEDDTQVDRGDLVVINVVLRSTYLPGYSVSKKDTPKTLHVIVTTKRMSKSIIIGITQKPIDLTRRRSGT
jgi:hypothetical protein